LEDYQQLRDQAGAPTGEELFVVQPRSYLVVGTLSEFTADRGPNLPKYRAFEDYRRNLRQPEILTFDELYERAKFIVDHAASTDREADSPSDDDEVPF
jgi:hypothetical protein